MSAKDRQVGTDAYKGKGYSEFTIQPIDFIVKNNLGWHEGNAIKYIARHKFKNGVEDIDKAIHYLELLKEEFYAS